MAKAWISSVVFAAVAAFGGMRAEAAVVINEIWNGTGYDEWIEFYNTGTAPVNMSGWRMVRRSEVSVADYVFYTFPPATTIGPGSYHVIGTTPAGLPVDGIYNSIVSGASNFSFALKDANGAVIDSIACGLSPSPNARFYAEGEPFGNYCHPGTSTLRRPNGTDTNDNRTDFRQSPSSTFRQSNDVLAPARSAATIAEARTTTVGEEVIVEGTVIVTSPSGFGNNGRRQFTVQDTSGSDGRSGLTVDDPSDAAEGPFAPGHRLTGLRGILTSADGFLQLLATQPVATKITGPPLFPLLLTGSVTDFETIESELIRIDGATVTLSGPWASSFSYPLGSPLALAVREIRTPPAFALEGTPLPQGIFSIQGIAVQNRNALRIQPRGAADITPPAAAADWTLYDLP